MVQQKQLLQKMEEATTVLKTLKDERDTALARISTLEHENREIEALLTLVEAKVEEMLSTGSAVTKTGLNTPYAPAQRRTEAPAASSPDQPRSEPVAVAAAQRKAESPAMPAERKTETPAASVKPEADTKATTGDRAQDKAEQAKASQSAEEKAPSKGGLTDLKDRFRRPFP